MRLLEVYLNSVEIKKQLVKRSEEFQIPFKFICSEIGINYKKFLNDYINAADSSTYKITEDNFEKILDMLGMETRFSIVLKKDFDFTAMRDKLKINFIAKNGG